MSKDVIFEKLNNIKFGEIQDTKNHLIIFEYFGKRLIFNFHIKRISLSIEINGKYVDLGWWELNENEIKIEGLCFFPTINSHINLAA